MDFEKRGPLRPEKHKVGNGWAQAQPVLMFISLSIHTHCDKEYITMHYIATIYTYNSLN